MRQVWNRRLDRPQFVFDVLAVGLGGGDLFAKFLAAGDQPGFLVGILRFRNAGAGFFLLVTERILLLNQHISPLPQSEQSVEIDGNAAIAAIRLDEVAVVTNELKVEHRSSRAA